ncbi:MAG: FAD-dependent oxidoreductase, partial [Bacteroidota bacterium]
MLKYESDIIIVGAGIAGLIAALELLDGGKKVMLIDRDKANEIGGLAKWAFGGMFFVDTKHQRKQGIKDSIDLATRDWYSYAEFEETETWSKQWANQFIHLTTDHGYHWLQQKGVRFFFGMNWAERGLFVQGNSVPRFHMVWGTGYDLVNNFKQKVLHHSKKGNLSFYAEHRVQDLMQSKGKVVGVNGLNESNGSSFEAF